MYQQDLSPVSDSLGLSSIFAVLPVLTLFVLLGVLRLKAQWAALISLGVAIVVALAVYGMPFDQTALSASEGATFGLFPIMWIVVAAMWLYNMTVETGHFDVLKRSFGAISDDQRVQAVIIAFCFGALLEALAGFGTPVAIGSVMLIGLGFKPMKAVALTLVADTVPVAFGAIAIPITTLETTAGIPKQDLGSMVGRQTPFLALIVPLILIAMVDGRRGIRQAWPVAVVGGLTFAIFQFLTSNYISVELTDVVAALAATGAIVGFLQLWHPTGAVPTGRFTRPAVAGGESHNPTLEREIQKREEERKKDSGIDIARAYAPYAIIVAVFLIAQLGPVKTWMAKSPWTKTFNWPGLHVTNAKGEALTSLTFNFNWLPAAGTLMLISGLLTMLALGVGPGRAVRAFVTSVSQLKWAILTVAAVLALAYVMNQSGQTVTLGTWAAGAGSAFALLAGLIGWLGVAVTGSDTSSNALFGALQVTAAKNAGLSPTLMAAANSSGGVIGKMISPQNLAIGAAAAGLAGREGDLFRKVLVWTVLLIVLMCGLIYLQSTSVLDWMVVK
jgi:lactate permease